MGHAGNHRGVAPSLAVARSLELGDESFTLHGLYFSAAYAIENHRRWRTWLGARVEGLRGDALGRAHDVVGVALRLASELYAAGASGGASGRAAAFFAGTFAIGVYVEGVKRFGLPSELGDTSLGAGVTMRVPFIAAIGD